MEKTDIRPHKQNMSDKQYLHKEATANYKLTSFFILSR